MENDPVNHPSHYTSGKYECIDFIESWHLGFHLGNAVKYITRAGKKDQAKTIEDLNKALWYLRRFCENGTLDDPHRWGNGTIHMLDYCKDKELSPRLTSAVIAILAMDIHSAIQDVEIAISEMERKETE